jgi:hypothetical protein
MLWIFCDIRHRHLVRAPRSFHLVVINFGRRGPAFGRAQHNHRPARALRFTAAARSILNASDLRDAMLERGRNRLMHALAIRAFYEKRLVSVTAKQLLQFFAADARENRRVVDLVSVQVKNRQYCAVANWLMNLFECQEVASGPVSASPSPQ